MNPAQRLYFPWLDALVTINQIKWLMGIPPGPFEPRGTPPRRRWLLIGVRAERKEKARARALANFRRIQAEGVPAQYLSAFQRRRLAAA